MWIYLIILGVVWIGLPQTGSISEIAWIRIFGFALLFPAVFLIAGAIAALTRGELVKTGMMGIVRHPMYLGTAVASLSLILIFQSILSLGFSVAAVALLWAASVTEDAFNIERFGESYREHMTRVPRWNVFRRLKT